jgi:hypothetical protein
MFIGILLVSCNNTPSYSDRIRAEQRAINKLIASEGLEILTKYPADGVFGDNQFVKLDNGLYLNIVDTGNGNHAVKYKTKILMRCSGKYLTVDGSDTTNYRFSLFTNSYGPIEFTYGYAESSMVSYDYYTYSPYSHQLGIGIDSAVAYVGENGIVKLIVPFDLGSSYQISEYTPMYYDRIKFMFY